MKKIFLTFLLLPGLAACGSAGQISLGGQSPEVPDEQIVADAAEEAAFTPTDPDKALLRSHYQLDVSFNYAQQSIAVLEQITYLNSSAATLKEIYLVVEAPRQGADFVLEALYWADGESIEDYSVSDGSMQISLPDPLAPEDHIVLMVEYQLGLPAQAGPLGTSARQSNFVDWYPFVPPYAEKAWLVHPAGEVGEHLAYESADFDVRIRIVDAPEDVLIAAPALAMKAEDGSIYRLEGARRFAWSASKDFEVLQSDAAGITISAYVFPEHREAGTAAMESSGEALKTYARLFGSYPYESLSIVEAQFPDGLESDGLFFLSEGFFEAYDGGQQNYLTTLSAHEVAHNWWFGLAGNDPAIEPWLDEALATYSELLYYENVQPDYADWWWRFRVLAYSPSGAVDSSIYEHEAFAPYVNAVYFRGALFLDELRREMGEEAFFSFLQDYLQAAEGRLLSGEDFFELLDRNEQKGIREIVDEYLSD